METLYLVTGAAGHLGRVVVQQLLKEKKKVRVLVLPTEPHLFTEEVAVCFGDVTKSETLTSFFAREAHQTIIVIHCAGIVSTTSKYSQALYDVNVNGTKNIVDLCLLHQVKRLVYVSSVHAIPEKPKGEKIVEVRDFSPDLVIGQYAKTKAIATAYVLAATQKGLDAVVVHPSGIVGPYDYGKGHLTTLVIEYYHGRLTAGIEGGYDFVDVRDVANGLLLACEKGRTGECYILSNHFYTIKEILTLLQQVSEHRKIKTYLPLSFLNITASIAEFYYKLRKQTPLYTPYSLYTLTSNANFSHAKATKELGYQTRRMELSLRDTITWLKEQKRIK